MTDESDGIAQAITGQLRVALTLAAQASEHAARLLQERMLQQQQASEQRGRELQARLDAERHAARAQLAVANRDDWWENADPAQIADLWQTAKTWEAHDAEAAAAVSQIRTQVQNRYGVDVDQPGATREQLDQALTAAQNSAVADLHAAAAADRDAAAILAGTSDDLRANDKPSEAAHVPGETEAKWDSPDRRQGTAERLEGHQDGPELQQAWMLTDEAQGLHPGEALALAGKAGAKKSAKGSQRARSTQREKALTR